MAAARTSDGLTERQDAFAVAYVETACATEAYKRAGYSTNNSAKTLNEAASRLLANSKVRARIEALKEAARQRHKITMDRLTGMALDAYELAMSEKVKAPSAAVRATEFLGQLHGLMVERGEHKFTTPDGKPVAPVINVTIGGKPNGGQAPRVEEEVASKQERRLNSSRGAGHRE